MNERDESLGRQLLALRDDIEPTNADLVSGVAAAIVPVSGRTRRPLARAVAVLLLVGVFSLTFAPARTALASWFGIGNTRVDVIETLPEATPTTRPAESIPPQEESLPDIPLPESALTGPVLERETRDLDGVAEFIVRYAAVTLSATAAESDITFVKSVAGPLGVSSAIITDGSAALWIEGPHTRTIGNVVVVIDTSTLVWVREGYEYRLTGDISRDLAITIAESIG